MGANDPELVGAIFPILWDSEAWQTVIDQPQEALNNLRETIAGVGGRLEVQIPDFESHSALLMVEGVENFDRIRSVIDMDDRLAGHCVTWQAVGTEPIDWKQPDLTVLPEVITAPGDHILIRDALMALPPRTYTCDECKADLSREDHRPNCSWRNLS
jgi:hypothetical protein